MNLKEPNKKASGERIRARRELLNITREQLAGYLSISTGFLSDVENGSKSLSVKNYYKLKQILGIGLDYIFDGNEGSLPEDEKRRKLSENILGSLSVCSVEQLGCMEQIARLYVEGIVNKE